MLRGVGGTPDARASRGSLCANTFQHAMRAAAAVLHSAGHGAARGKERTLHAHRSAARLRRLRRLRRAAARCSARNTTLRRV